MADTTIVIRCSYPKPDQMTTAMNRSNVLSATAGWLRHFACLRCDHITRLSQTFADTRQMDYTVPCGCGRSLIVRAGDAGATKLCDCGKQLQIPPLSVLHESPNVHGASTDARSRGGHAGVFLFVATIVIALLASLQSPALLVPLGLLTFIVGRVWFAMQILREMAPPNALVVLFVPFMPTMFFFQRLEITWKPFAYGIMGIAMLLIGLPVSQP